MIHNKPTKVALFAGNDADILQRSINNFISNKNIIDIKYASNVLPTQYDNNGNIISTTVNDRILVIYEED